MWLDRTLLERKSMPAPAPVQRHAPRQRLNTGERLLRAILAFAGPNATLVSQREAPWASITFSGARHSIVLAFHGWEACDDAENLIVALPDHEFTIPNVLVAEATVTRTNQELLPSPSMEVELDLLLLDAK